MADKNWWDYPVTRGFLWSWTEWIRHSGIDYGAPCGTPILQPTPGTVIHSGVHPWGGQIDVLVNQLPGYEPGPHVMTYLHSSAQYVQEGQRVSAGTILGLSGQPPPGAGYGAGCHVHFEITHGNTAPYTTYSPSRNPSQSSYPESGAPYVARLQHGGGGDKPRDANCGPAPKPTDFTNQANYALAVYLQGICVFDQAASNNCGDLPQRNAFPDDASWLVQAQAWQQCYSSHHFGGLGNPLDPLKAIADFITNIPHNIIRVGKIVFGFGLCAIGLVLAFLPDVGAGLATAFGAPEFASAIRQGVSGGLGGAARGGIRAASLVPGRQRTAERVRQRELRANVVAQRREAERAQREAIRHAPKTRPLPSVHVARPSTPLRVPEPTAQERATTGRLLARTGKVDTSINQRNAPPRTAQALGFGPRRERQRQDVSLSEKARKRETKARERNRSAIQKTAQAREGAGLSPIPPAARPPAGARFRAPRLLPSVQNQPERAGYVRRGVARAIRRRRGT